MVRCCQSIAGLRPFSGQWRWAMLSRATLRCCLKKAWTQDRFRPPREPSFGETLLRKVVSLAVIAEETNRRSTATSKNKNAAGKRIFRELFLAYPSQGINALTPVNRLDRHQHAHLRRDMDHRSDSRQARSSIAQSGVEEPFH